MMKKCLLLFFFLFLFTDLISQDRIVLRKDETVIPCRIISVNDTLIIYRPASSPDEVMKARRFDVLSWFIEAPAPSSATKKRLISKKEKPKKEPYRYLNNESVIGYIVDSKGDTLNGEIMIRNFAYNQLQVHFTDESGKKHLYPADDSAVMAYGYGDIHYRKMDSGIRDEVVNGVHSKSGKLFLQILVDGPAQLYLFSTLKFPLNLVKTENDPPLYAGKIKQYYFMVNAEGEKLLAKNRTVKGCVNRLLDDDAKLMSQVRMKGLKKHEVPDTFKLYNERYRKKQ